MVGVAFKNLKAGSLASSRQCFDFLGLFSLYLRLHMHLHNDATPPVLNSYIHWFIQQLKQLDKDNRPKSAALRRHTLEEWQVVDGEIARRQLAHKNDEWRRVARAWQVARTHLLPESGEPHWTPFGALERCA
ncbi:hypothetical protein PsYK624_094790 [Phanerochaete sordida]|uniref:Uncharacterized protein n=1 Tax=Phanerochaete sordida TaxID=48140 RepID=A0A9P3GEG6_9APHY|nr:hypothetical protein PsYK624_094790 [Phanerochaete sordida]